MTAKKQNFSLWSDIEARQHPRLILESLPRVLEWLQELHAEGRGHGDIRPASLMVVEQHEFCRESFTRYIRPEIRQHSTFAPPEVFWETGPSLTPTPQADLYSLTAVLYLALTGHNAPRSPVRMTGGTLEVPKRLGPAVAELLRAGMALKPEERPASTTAYRELLDRALKSKEVASLPPLLDGRRPDVASRLPKNLSVGKETEISIKDIIRDQGRWEIESLPDCSGLGVSLDREAGMIRFKPEASGEFQVELNLRLPGIGLGFDRRLRSMIDVTVNADPKALWKEIEPPADAPFHKGHTDFRELRTSHARMHGASRRGRSHAHEGSFREDDLSLAFHEKSGWHLMVASDGAGSAKLSRRGSQVVCSQAIEQLTGWLDASKDSEGLAQAADLYAASPSPESESALRTLAYDLLGKAAFEVRKALQKEAEQMVPPAALRDFHSTLLIACARKTELGWVLASFTIGDGGIVYCKRDGIPVAFCAPDSGEFSGQTTFITVPGVLKDAQDIMRRIHVAHVPDLESLVLMTDGVTDPIFPTEESLADKEVWSAFWNKLPEDAKSGLEGAESRESMLEWLNFWSPGNHDDRTIILLIPKS